MFDITKYQREPEFHNLTAYQATAASTVAEAIQRKGAGLEAGPRYISMPVGAGKTTGAVWGIVRFVQDNPEKKVCFMTPYVTGVEAIAAVLAERLGQNQVGYFHADKGGSKQDQVSKPVFVCTHQFAAYNHSLLNDRDLVVVDEAIYGSKDANLTANAFYGVWQWACNNDILKDDFRAVFDLVDGHAKDSSGRVRFAVLDYVSILPALERIRLRTH